MPHVNSSFRYILQPYASTLAFHSFARQPARYRLVCAGSAGGVRFLGGGNLRCWKKSSCLSDAGASSGFFSAVLADFRRLRSQPPTKPQHKPDGTSPASVRKIHIHHLPSIFHLHHSHILPMCHNHSLPSDITGKLHQFLIILLTADLVLL